MDKDRREWVWFDLDDTLHDFTFAAKKGMIDVYDLFIRETRLPLEALQTAYKKALQRQGVLEFTDGRTSHDYRMERFLSALERGSLTDEAKACVVEEALSIYEKSYMDNLSLKPYARESLFVLKEQGHSLALLTDAPEDAQMRVLEKLGLSNIFDMVFTSGATGVSKKGGLFIKALEKTAADKERVIMVGNSTTSDIEPALAVGIDAVWFNDRHAPNKRKYKEINSLQEILKYR